MSYRIVGWSESERRFREAIYTKREVWQWLKAERRHLVLARRQERQAGVNEHILKLRRRGKPEAPIRVNRAARRAFARHIKRAA